MVETFSSVLLHTNFLSHSAVSMLEFGVVCSLLQIKLNIVKQGIDTILIRSQKSVVLLCQSVVHEQMGYVNHRQ